MGYVNSMDNISLLFLLSLCGTVYGPFTYLMASRKKLMFVNSSEENKAGELKAHGKAIFISGVIGVISLSPIILEVGGPLLHLLGLAICIAGIVLMFIMVYSAQIELLQNEK